MFLTECPRDAMQGWGEFIPTAKKIDYINTLMMWVSMYWTAEVLFLQNRYRKWQIREL